MLIHNLAIPINQEGVRRVAHVHGAFEVAVDVKEHIEAPTLAFHDRLYLGGGTRVVDGDGINLHAGGLRDLLLLLIS